MITRKGNYDLDAHGLVLEVVEFGDGLLHYNLVQSSGVELLKSSRGMSSSSRWFMQWQSEDLRLWVYSGDIGTVAWMKDELGVFREKAVSKDATLVNAMPSAFYDRLPRVLKTRWPRVEK